MWRLLNANNLQTILYSTKLGVGKGGVGSSFGDPIPSGPYIYRIRTSPELTHIRTQTHTHTRILMLGDCWWRRDKMNNIVRIIALRFGFSGRGRRRSYIYVYIYARRPAAIVLIWFRAVRDAYPRHPYVLYGSCVAGGAYAEEISICI